MNMSNSTDTQTKPVQNQLYYYAVGRRKSATARAKYFPSTDPLQVSVNNKPIEKHFENFYQLTILKALEKLGVSTGKMALYIKGGGVMGQAEAARLALAKALVKYDEGFKVVARMYGFLTTDIRKVAPKHAGLRKNRKREQWSKR